MCSVQYWCPGNALVMICKYIYMRRGTPTEKCVTCSDYAFLKDEK